MPHTKYRADPLKTVDVHKEQENTQTDTFGFIYMYIYKTSQNDSFFWMLILCWLHILCYRQCNDDVSRSCTRKQAVNLFLDTAETLLNITENREKCSKLYKLHESQLQLQHAHIHKQLLQQTNPGLWIVLKQASLITIKENYDNNKSNPSNSGKYNTHLSQVLHPLVYLFWLNTVLSPSLQIQITSNI